MSTSRPLPPFDAAHERHDALLIAQLGAGDRLDPREAAQARQLVGSCAECAALAADLRAIATAVAWEPIPPRRRDFRIDPTRAEQLRGPRWSRLLRRLSLPQSAALRPAAAGVLSLGLVLVVAGSVWPTTESAAPAPIVQPGAGIVTDEVAATTPTAERQALEAPAAPTLEDDATGVDAPAAADAAAMEESDSSAKASTLPPDDVDATAQDRLAAEQGLTGEGAAPAERGRTDTEPDAGDARIESMAMEAGPPSSPPADELRDAATLQASSALGEVAAPAPSTGAAASMAPLQQEQAATGADRDAGVALTSASATVVGLGVDELLVWVGAILAVGGAIVLLVAWLARRAADPLLR